MKNAISFISKEQYASRKTVKEIVFKDKVLSEAAGKIPKEYFEKGEYYFNQNEFDEAVKCYRNAIMHKPDFAIAYCKKGYSNLIMSKFYNAILDFDKAIQHSPYYNDAYFGRANTKAGGFRDYEGAIEDFDKAIELAPKDIYAYFFRGKAKYYSGNLKGAIEDLLKVGEHETNEAMELCIEIISKITEKNHEAYSIVEYLSKKIEQDKTNPEYYYKRALEKEKLEDYKNAIADLQVVIHLRGTDPAICANIAMLFYCIGNDKFNVSDGEVTAANYKEAIYYSNKAIELDNNNANAFFARGLARRMLGDRDGSMADLKKAHELGDIRLSEKMDELLNELNRDLLFDGYIEKGNYFSDKQQYAEAGFYYKRALELKPRNSDCIYLIGVSKLNLKEYEDAIAIFTEAIHLNPMSEFSFLNRGNAKLNLKDFDGAADDYSKAIGLNPKLVPAFINRGIAKFELSDDSGAISDYSKAIEIDPQSTIAHHHRGKAKKHINDHASAVEDFTFVIQNDPANAYSFFYRGITRISLSQFNEAREDLIKSGQLGYKRAYEIIEEYLGEKNSKWD